MRVPSPVSVTSFEFVAAPPPPVARQNALTHNQWHEVGMDQLTNQMATANIGIEAHNGAAPPAGPLGAINTALRDSLGMEEIDLSGMRSQGQTFPPETRDAQVRIATLIRAVVVRWFPELVPLMRPMGNVENGSFHFGHHLFWHLSIMYTLHKHILQNPSAHSEQQVRSMATLHHLFNSAAIQATYQFMNLPGMA